MSNDQAELQFTAHVLRTPSITLASYIALFAKAHRFHILRIF